MNVPLVNEIQSLCCSLSATKRGISLRLLNKAAGSGTTGAYREEKGIESFFLIPGCSKRPSSKAAGSHRTENDAGCLFQQPLRLDGDVHERRHTIRPLLIRHPQFEPICPFLRHDRREEGGFCVIHVQQRDLTAADLAP